MNARNRKYYLGICCGAAFLAASPCWSDTRNARGALQTPTNINNLQARIADAAEVYRLVAKDPSRRIPQSVLQKAKCVAVFSEVKTAAIAIGGVHGDGVALCKDAAGTWGSPAFVNLTGGSIGVQAGAKSADLVLFFNNEDARERLKQGKFILDGELSAVAGKYDESFSAPSGGVVAYSRTEGAFLGASVSGTGIAVDTDEQKTLYGTKGTESLFGQPVPERMRAQVKELVSMLPA